MTFHPSYQPRRRRRRTHPLVRLIQIGLVLGMVGMVAGFGAVATNAFGMGDRFERVVDRIERFLAGPPPDRPTVPTVRITPPPSEPTPSPSRRPTDPTAAPTPSLPPRAPVDVDILADPVAVFAHELQTDWCAPAGVQMVLAIHGQGDTSEAFQREIASRVREWESRSDSLNGRWGPAAISESLADYGVPGYVIHAYDTRADAMRGAAASISETGAPAVLLTWRGAHTWVMSGYRADADPRFYPDAVVSGAYILDPWYPDVSSIWGASDPPGTFQDEAEMERNFLPWKRPEGLYPERDGRFIVLLPTLPLAEAD